MSTPTGNSFAEMAARIREMREIVGYSVEQMAGFCEITPKDYEALEAGTADPAFSVIHKCALAFGVDVTALMEGYSAKLSGYTVTRKGRGPVTAKEEGIELRNMAAMFKGRLATPYYVTYTYDEKLQNAPIHTSTHGGQEFDLVLEGQLKVKIGEHVEILEAGDSIFYKSSTPHGMIAIGGKDCKFLAMIMAGSEHEQNMPVETLKAKQPTQKVVGENFVDVLEDEHGCLKHVKFKDIDRFNFAFDCVDAIAKKDPDKLALLHVSDHFTERRFTFRDMMEMSNQVANYMLNLGIRRGDKVILVLKRHFQFWPTILACHKIGAVVIPATNQLMVHDFAYRFKAADVKAIFCTADGITAEQAEIAMKEMAAESEQSNNPNNRTIIKVIVNGNREGWHSFDAEYIGFSRTFERTADGYFGFVRTHGGNSVKMGYVAEVDPDGLYHYSQAMNDHYLFAVKKAAEHKIMVNQHEAVRPTGLCRTWPNLICNEAARGQEFDSFGHVNTFHTTVLPFTRLIGGPMDYTPGIVEPNLKLANPRHRKTHISSTVARQLALYLTMPSPLQMAADLPENYEANPVPFEFIRDVPVDWSKSVYLSAEPGDHVLVARRDRRSDAWYAGCTVGDRPFTARFGLGFLEPGVTYRAKIWQDGKDASWNANPKALDVVERTVTSADSLEIPCVAGGGFALSLKKAK
mgnify:CR=1 FL=1